MATQRRRLRHEGEPGRTFAPPPGTVLCFDLPWGPQGQQQAEALVQMSFRGPGQGMFSGCFRSSKFTQRFCLSRHEKSLRSGPEWWGRGATPASCGLWVGPLPAPPTSCFWGPGPAFEGKAARVRTPSLGKTLSHLHGTKPLQVAPWVALKTTLTPLVSVFSLAGAEAPSQPCGTVGGTHL